MKKTLLIISSYIFYTGISAQVPGAWSFAADMGEVRNGHTATFINDSVLLVTGGFNGTENVKTAEVYNPTSDSWSNTGEMDSIRFQHTATALNNGKAIIAGGWDGGFLNYYGTQIYDPATHSFSAGPFMHTGRSGHTATKLQNGKVLFVGGYSDANGNTNIVDLYDPETNTISLADSLHYGRSYHCAVLLDDGRVLVAGGYNPDYGFQMNSVEIYNPETDVWIDAASMSTARDYFGMVNISENESVFAAGGRFFNGSNYEGSKSVEIYQVESNEWVPMEDLPEGQSYMQIQYFEVGMGIAPAEGELGYPYIIIPGSTNESGTVDLTFSHSYAYGLYGEPSSYIPMFIDGRYFYASERIAFSDPLGIYHNPILVCGGFDKIVEIFEPGFWSTIISETNKTFSISPNPANTEIHLKLRSDQFPESYSIYNVSGQKIFSNHISGSDQLRIPVAELLSGMYMVQLTLEDGSLPSAFFIKE